MLLLDLPTPALATHRAEAMLAALENGIEVEGMQITVEAAGGIALAPGSGGIDELMRRADVAMYQAKRAGQQTATYAHARDTADVGRLMLGGELRRAVSRAGVRRRLPADRRPGQRRGHLGRGAGPLASPRARPPHPGPVPARPWNAPASCPPSPTRCSTRRCRPADSWREAGFDLPIAVNVSPRSLLDPRFPATVLDRLERHGVPADRLVLELAETLTISQLDVVEPGAGRAARGRRAAWPSTTSAPGVSSLSVLSHIPVHQLKIDREFVTAIETSSEAAAVVRSTVDLARSLHLTVVAEGVESEPQRRALWELGLRRRPGPPLRPADVVGAPARHAAARVGRATRARWPRPLHDGGAVVRMPRRQGSGTGRSLPHLPA